MNFSPLLLLGVGGAGCAIVRGISRASGDGVRYLLCDTDAETGAASDHFVMLGADRLAGHGAGGDVVQARLATDDSLHTLEKSLEGVRLVILVTGLGGGTGGGGTLSITKRLKSLGIPTLVFGTLPFRFEGENRQRNAIGMTTSIAEEASASIFIPLDKLVGDADVMNDALRRAMDALASGITLFWRLIGKPGYIKLDAEDVRRIIARAGNGRFAVMTTQGPNRANDAVDALSRAETLTVGASPVRTILCGILAGDDLKLSEIGTVADGLRAAFGERCAFHLATVNDEETFSGRLSVVVMLFETRESALLDDEPTTPAGGRRPRRNTKNPLQQGPQGRGRFNNVEPTVWHNEDLDTPTFLRRNISLDI